MKLFIKSVFTLILLTAATNLFAQPGSNSNFIPELVFQNPVLVSGSAGQDGAIYRFNNVASDIDATVKIVGRSGSSVVLSNIDDNSLGWRKAFQPILGIPGTVSANQNWWMEFEMRFYKAGTNDKKKIKGFQVTAIDVDGDGGHIQEYIQMNKIQSVAYSPVTYLIENPVMTFLNNLLSESGDNLKGINKLVQGPIQNFTNIDTAGTGVMSTFTYEDKDMITFRYGAKSNGTGSSSAGERMNSLWFKAFNLSPQGTLPVTFHNFTASYDKKNVVLNWTADTDDTFSHYSVERSTDGKNYSEIGIVFTSGAMLTNYQFKDANVNSSTNMVFYRLRWKSAKEKDMYSQVRVIKLNSTEKNFQIVTYPNPVINELRVTLPNDWQGKAVQLELYSTNGTRMQSQQITNASQTEVIKTSSLAKGFYIVKASYNGQSLQQRIIKD